MSLPDKHRTARYESLPKGLKAKAEAIINKKFGLREGRKAKVEGKPFFANGVTPVTVFDGTIDALNSTALADGRFRGISPGIESYGIKPKRLHYNWHRREFAVLTICPRCRFENVNSYAEEQLPSGRDSHMISGMCMSCKVYIDTLIDSRDCWNAVHIAERDMAGKSAQIDPWVFGKDFNTRF